MSFNYKLPTPLTQPSALEPAPAQHLHRVPDEPEDKSYGLFFVRQRGLRATKLHGGGEPQSAIQYAGPFDFEPTEVTNLVELQTTLGVDPDVFLLNACPRCDHRLLLAGKVGNRKGPTHADGAWEPYDCRIVSIDFDLDDNSTITDLARVWDVARPRLPACFQQADVLVQASSSTGIPGKGARARLWFFADEPVSQTNLASALGQAEGVDLSLYDMPHPNYVAAPVFEGVEDPLEGRSRFLLVSGTRTHVSAAEIRSLAEAASASAAEALPRKAEDISAEDLPDAYREQMAERAQNQLAKFVRENPAGRGMYPRFNDLGVSFGKYFWMLPDDFDLDAEVEDAFGTKYAGCSLRHGGAVSVVLAAVSDIVDNKSNEWDAPDPDALGNIRFLENAAKRAALAPESEITARPARASYTAVSELAEYIDAAIDWIYEPWQISHGRISLVTAKTNSGKSVIALGLFVSLATGKPFLGRSVQRRKVLWLDYEMGRRAVGRKIRQLLRGHGLDLVDASGAEVSCSGPRLHKDLRAEWVKIGKRVGQGGVVFVDAFRAAANADDENRAETAQALYMLGRVSEETGACFVVLSHSNKGKPDDMRDSMSGSLASVGAAGVMIVLDGQLDQGVTVSCGKVSQDAPEGRFKPEVVRIVDVDGAAGQVRRLVLVEKQDAQAPTARAKFDDLTRRQCWTVEGMHEELQLARTQDKAPSLATVGRWVDDGVKGLKLAWYSSKTQGHTLAHNPAKHLKTHFGLPGLPPEKRSLCLFKDGASAPQVLAELL